MYKVLKKTNYDQRILYPINSFLKHKSNFFEHGRIQGVQNLYVLPKKKTNVKLNPANKT